MSLYRSLRRLTAAILTLAAALAGLAGGAQPARAQDGRLVWSAIPGIPADVALEDIFMVGGDMAWVAARSRDGSAGYAYRLQLREGRWQVERAGTFRAGLYGVAALDAENVWLVGDYGLIVRRDSTGWREVPAPSDQMTIRDVQLLGDGSAGWAVGDQLVGSDRQPIALRYDGRIWQSAAVDLPAGGGYMAALHLGGGGGWAVGSQIWRLRDGAWRADEAPNPCGQGYGCAAAYSAVRAIDAERAIAVGLRRGICSACSTNAYVARRDRGGWADLYPNGLGGVVPEPPQHPQQTHLGGLYLTGADSGLAVGTRFYPGAAEIFGLRLSGGAWRYEQILPLSGASVNDVFMPDATRALVVGTDGLLLSYGYGSQAAPPPAGNPARPVPDPGQAGVRYFPETSHTLRGVFLRYWEQNGGLSRFGYPLTEEFAEVSAEDGRTYTVQYFERARFEHHPEFAGSQYEVLLGLLGHWVTAERKGEGPFQPAPPTGQPGGVYFPETGHTMAAEFAGYWGRNGGLPIYGYPISEAFYEVNAADGRSYLVQYFERNRFEYHPELAGTPYEVLLGLLGSEYLAAKGWR